MIFRNTIAIRVDIDTFHGLRKGVPSLLAVFKELGVKATFFCVMGPDQMGRHAFRFRKKNYLKRIIKVNPFKLIKSYGISPFLYGTFLPAPMIGGGNPKYLNNITKDGHELGLHSYNHNSWADNYFSNYNHQNIANDFKSGQSAFRNIVGSKAYSFAAPNWRSDEKLFEQEEKESFKYCSDLRGFYPFFPEVKSQKFNILQIPATLPCSHESIQSGMDRGNTVEYLISKLSSTTINVWTIHDWFEGMYRKDLV